MNPAFARCMRNGCLLTSWPTTAWTALANHRSSSPISCASASFPAPIQTLISSSKNRNPNSRFNIYFAPILAELVATPVQTRHSERNGAQRSEVSRCGLPAEKERFLAWRGMAGVRARSFSTVSFKPHALFFCILSSRPACNSIYRLGGSHDYVDVTPNVTPDAHRIHGAHSFLPLRNRVRAGAKKGFSRHLPAGQRKILFSPGGQANRPRGIRDCAKRRRLAGTRKHYPEN